MYKEAKGREKQRRELTDNSKDLPDDRTDTFLCDGNLKYKLKIVQVKFN